MQAHSLRQQQKEKAEYARVEGIRKKREIEETETRKLRDEKEGKIRQERRIEEEQENKLEAEDKKRIALESLPVEQMQEQYLDNAAADSNIADEASADAKETDINMPMEQADGESEQEPEEHFGDDSYLYSNNFGTYDDGMEQSLFELEYMNQMGDI